MTDPMAAEFDTLAAWTAEVAADLGPDYYVTAGCRGTGSPAALDWLLTELGTSGASRMLDCGAGVGGPAGYARERSGVRPMLAEPAMGACRASRRLFGLPVVQADATALPFADASFDQAWSLGVVCTMQQHAVLLRELRRVLVPGGRAGLLVFCANVADLDDEPAGNEFPTEQSLRADVRDTGFSVTASAAVADLPSAPREWTSRLATVEAELESRHRGDPALVMAQEQEAKVKHLIGSGQVSGVVLALRTE